MSIKEIGVRDRATENARSVIARLTTRRFIVPLMLYFYVHFCCLCDKIKQFTHRKVGKVTRTMKFNNKFCIFTHLLYIGYDNETAQKTAK